MKATQRPGSTCTWSAGWWLDPALARDYAAVAAAIELVAERRQAQPSLEVIAAHVGLSRFRLQRLFVRWAGISPKQFLGHLNLVHAKRLLRERASVLEAALDTGLSGAGRLHDLFVSVEAMTPGEYAKHGHGLVIRHAVVATALGPALALVTARGLCGLQFIVAEDADAVAVALEQARQAWPLSRLVADREAVESTLYRLFDGSGKAADRLPLLLRGTRFQLNVWEALLRVPPGSACSYSQLATTVGVPSAARAVGGAVARNPVAVLIPCHRVLRSNGALGGYRWGRERKLALLAREWSVGPGADRLDGYL